MIIAKTKSVCPVCLRTVPAEKDSRPDGIYMVKSCPEHGPFSTLIWEGNLKSYLLWQSENSAVDPPVHGREPENGCPNDCGLCTEHLRKGCCMLLELTNRCNLRCPVCFASAGQNTPMDLSLQEISDQYDFLLAHGGPFNIQLSGGEPTVRDDLPEIIRLGRSKGFSFFQLNTNGIRLAEDAAYARELKEAGLCTVYLQFDGLTDDVYRTLRGRDLFSLKEKAIENSAAAGLGVVLVPVIVPGVNDGQIGDILRYGLRHSPDVRGVHFQPISYFGRCSQERPARPVTIPRMLRLIEEQTSSGSGSGAACGNGTATGTGTIAEAGAAAEAGIMKNCPMRMTDFAGGGAENPYCSFHASYRVLPDGSLKLMPKKSGSCCCCTTSDDSRTSVAAQWQGVERDQEPEDGFDEFLREMHNSTFTVSGMLFQDAWNLDLERLKRCYICEVDSRYGMVPFCAYNLTNTEGKYLYRK